jgi:hypothetical protein
MPLTRTHRLKIQCLGILGRLTKKLCIQESGQFLLWCTSQISSLKPAEPLGVYQLHIRARSRSFGPHNSNVRGFSDSSKWDRVLALVCVIVPQVRTLAWLVAPIWAAAGVGADASYSPKCFMEYRVDRGHTSHYREQIGLRCAPVKPRDVVVYAILLVTASPQRVVTYTLGLLYFRIVRTTTIEDSSQL